jgi:hypothetical protein
LKKETDDMAFIKYCNDKKMFFSISNVIDGNRLMIFSTNDARTIVYDKAKNKLTGYENIEIVKVNSLTNSLFLENDSWLPVENTNKIAFNVTRESIVSYDNHDDDTDFRNKVKGMLFDSNVFLFIYNLD